MTRPGDLGEDALVERLTGLLTGGGKVVLGPGDDCAVVEGGGEGQLSVLKTDCLVEGVHYLPEAEGHRVGWKAVARVISDFAAMGAEPEHLLVTVALRSDLEVSWVEELYRGMDACAVRFGAAIVGGETSSLPEGAPVVISVAGTGRVEEGKWISRSGGQVGDGVYVTGRLGGSLAGKHLDFVPRLGEARWLVANAPVRAMMDLSDGLAKDLPRLAEASGCGFRLEREELPCNEGVDVAGAIGDGEDYELLVVMDGSAEGAWLVDWAGQFPELEMTRIGELREGSGGVLEGGWDHF